MAKRGGWRALVAIVLAAGALVVSGQPILAAGPEALARVGDRLWFAARDRDHGYELWRSDGTRGGTRLIADVAHGERSSWPNEMTPVGGRVFFVASTAKAGREVWVSDGTAKGTRLVREVVTGTASEPYPEGLVAAGGRLFFSVWANNVQLWTSDGTAAGTIRLRTVPFIYDTIAFRGRLWFLAGDASHDVSLWVSNGTRAGTHAVASIGECSGCGWPGQMTVAGDRLFFVAGDATNGNEVWTSDGTAKGTSMVRAITPGRENAPYSLVATHGRLAFAVMRHGTEEVWLSDGTAGGTFRLRGPNARPAFAGVDQLVDVHGTLYIFTYDGLWRSDGTPEGTTRVARDVRLAGDTSRRVAVLGSSLIFLSFDEVHGTELWVTNGTRAGTILLRDINAGPDGCSGEHLTAVAGRVFLSANDEWHGKELWVTNGTTAGTHLVRDIVRPWAARAS